MNTTNVATAICDRTIVATIIFYTLRPSNDRRSAAGGAHDITLQPPVGCSAWLDGVSKFSRGHMTAAGVVG